MVALDTALITMEAIGDSLMDGVTPIMAGVILIMDGVLLIMVTDTVMVMDTVLVMDTLIIEVEETVPMQEEQLIEEIIDILVQEEEQDIPIAEDLILLAEAAPILEENPTGDLVTVEGIQALDNQETRLIVEITPLEGPLIVTQDPVLAQDLILIEALAEAPEAVEVVTEVAEVDPVAEVAVEDVVEVKP